jgi:phosphatidylserine decarboxylase
LRLTVYGRGVVLKVLIISLVIDMAALFVPNEIIKVVMLGISIVLMAFTFYFFRDPVRTLPEDYNVNDIISPADGKVMMIEEIEENVYLKSKAKMIGIFLSPLNVHVNRTPVEGRVGYYQYVKGDYIVAFDHKSSERNERTLIGMDTGRFKILFKQIAGFVARRIVCDLRVDDETEAGETFGMIKFGSRVDVIFPDNAVVKVSVNQKVIGGETILAEVPVA